MLAPATCALRLQMQKEENRNRSDAKFCLSTFRYRIFPVSTILNSLSRCLFFLFFITCFSVARPFRVCSSTSVYVIHSVFVSFPLIFFSIFGSIQWFSSFRLFHRFATVYSVLFFLYLYFACVLICFIVAFVVVIIIQKYSKYYSLTNASLHTYTYNATYIFNCCCCCCCCFGLNGHILPSCILPNTDSHLIAVFGVCFGLMHMPAYTATRRDRKGECERESEREKERKRV